VTDDTGLLLPQFMDECDDVTDEVEYRILVPGIGAVGGPVAALVRRDYADPAAESASIWCRQEYQVSGQPCRSRTRGPSPCSAMCMLIALSRT
jgi:hypothetical protein